MYRGKDREENYLFRELLPLSACQTADKPDNTPRQIDYDLSGYLKSLPRDFPEVRKYHASDGSMLTFDGYRYGRKNPVAIIYLHGLYGHAAWGRELAIRLADRNYDVFALDRRGNGRSKGSGRTITGRPPGFEDLVSDIHAFLKPLKGYYDAVYLVGNDWGGRLALAYAIAYKGQSDGLVLISPLVGKGKLPGFDAARQASDPDRQQMLDSDPLRRQQLDENFVEQSRRMDDFIRRYIKRVDQPIQLFVAGDDDDLDRDRIERLLEKGNEPSLDIQVVPGARHALQFEAPDRIARDIHHWIRYQEMSRQSGKLR